MVVASWDELRRDLWLRDNGLDARRVVRLYLFAVDDGELEADLVRYCTG
jgi:hypothetical protein